MIAETSPQHDAAPVERIPESIGAALESVGYTAPHDS